MCVFFFKQKTAYEMRISDWSSDVCSSDLQALQPQAEIGGERDELVVADLLGQHQVAGPRYGGEGHRHGLRDAIGDDNIARLGPQPAQLEPADRRLAVARQPPNGAERQHSEERRVGKGWGS